MDNKDNEKRIHLLNNKVFLWVMVTGFTVSILLLGGSYLLKVSEPVKDILKELGVIVIGMVFVSLIQVKVLDEFYKQQTHDVFWPDLKIVEEHLMEELRRIIPEIKAETVESIEDISKRVAEATDYMRKGINVLSGAKSAGIINIYPNRYENIAGKSVIEEIKNDLQTESSMICIMGISLGDYFLDRGVIHSSFINLLETKNLLEVKPKIHALIVHPKCEMLHERARWEAGPEYYYDPVFFDSTTFIETDGAARIAKRLCTKFGSILEVRLYKQAPTAFVLLTSRFAFVESYNYAARGSNVPVFQIQAGVSLYRHYESHFNRIWEDAHSINTYDPLSDEYQIPHKKRK